MRKMPLRRASADSIGVKRGALKREALTRMGKRSSRTGTKRAPARYVDTYNAAIRAGQRGRRHAWAGGQPRTLQASEEQEAEEAASAGTAQGKQRTGVTADAGNGVGGAPGRNRIRLNVVTYAMAEVVEGCSHGHNCTSSHAMLWSAAFSLTPSLAML